MRQYRLKEIQLKETKEIEKIFCNKCGREIAMNHGRLEEDILEVEKRWGYFSQKDNQVDAFDLCEACYDEFVAAFVIPIGE